MRMGAQRVNLCSQRSCLAEAHVCEMMLPASSRRTGAASNASGLTTCERDAGLVVFGASDVAPEAATKFFTAGWSTVRYPSA